MVRGDKWLARLCVVEYWLEGVTVWDTEIETSDSVESSYSIYEVEIQYLLYTMIYLL